MMNPRHRVQWNDNNPVKDKFLVDIGSCFQMANTFHIRLHGRRANYHCASCGEIYTFHESKDLAIYMSE